MDAPGRPSRPRASSCRMGAGVAGKGLLSPDSPVPCASLLEAGHAASLQAFLSQLGRYRIYMMRRISLAAASAAMLALSALPASAAMASTTHKISFPGLSGVKAWGNYTKVAKGLKVNVCAED